MAAGRLEDGWLRGAWGRANKVTVRLARSPSTTGKGRLGAVLSRGEIQRRERFQNYQLSETRARHRASVGDLDHVQGSRHSEVLRAVRDVGSLYHEGARSSWWGSGVIFLIF